MTSPLEKEFLFYVDHQGQLLEQFEGKVLLIRDEKVIGAFDSEMEAIRAGVQSYPLGTFLVQRCEAGEESYTQTFHSGVMFEKR